MPDRAALLTEAALKADVQLTVYYDVPMVPYFGTRTARTQYAYCSTVEEKRAWLVAHGKITEHEADIDKVLASAIAEADASLT